MSDFKKIIEQIIAISKGGSTPRAVKGDGEQPSTQKVTQANLKDNKPAVITIAIIIFIAISLLNSIYIVKPNEYKVVRQFGEVVRVVKEAG
ncbi:MAG: hypothetical protein NUK65_04230, partial [Firmicutes bacterium]|nr:hypothetical protein [Bacillota bacterium]